MRRGAGASGWTTAFLLGMAAAMFVKLFIAGGETPEFDAARAGSDARLASGPAAGAERIAGPPAAHPRSGERTDRDGQPAARTAGRPDSPDRAENGASAGAEGAGIGQAGARNEPLVRVYLAEEGRVETVPLEIYVRGVVAGEMPADFEPEALKAQAIAARTYIIRKLLADRRNGDGGGGEYDVTDGPADQAYVSLENMRRMASERKEDFERIGQAVAGTEGLVLTYGGEPIQAAYFSTSGGYTENAEDYWSEPVPYLRSVPSPWDAQLSPRYEQEIGMTLDEFYDRLGIGRRDRKGGIEVLSRTAGRSVKEIRIGKRILTGREVREALDLPSANFDWRISGGRITLICRGHGHGVGMSQWGAQALALAGNDAERILAYYYRGARIERTESLAGLSGSFET